KAIAKVEAPKAEKKATKAAKVVASSEDDTAALQRKLAEKKAAKVDAEPKAEKAVAKTGGEGTLMISSKPPCEIWIDGNSTGLMTPQRAIPLSAGKHKITLVSPDKAHKKTIAVEITADKPTKVIQDLLK
ncbi:MAG: PEGA domain-containing protein, partial [Kofleriaceae bacterium]